MQCELERLPDRFAPRRVQLQHEQLNEVRRQRVLLVWDHLMREAIRHNQTQSDAIRSVGSASFSCGIT